MNENTTTPTKGEKNSLKKRKVALTTPPKQRKFSDNDITTETILRSPHKQSSTFFNSSHNHHQNSQITSDSNPSSRGRSHTSTETGTQIKTQEVSPYRKLSPARKGRSESPTSTGRRLSLVQLSPRRKNNKLQQLNHAIQRETLNQQTGGRRLYIHKLTLTNFKSYANEQVIGPFNENFTAVVGPNGSGKSNVIDSMLFVFGFRANKLRQGKLSELIHKSETFTDLNFCSVDVHFKYNYKDQSIANKEEDEELIVTRKAFKNNSSKYYVNNKESTYTKVTELLKKEGIDLDHKRFLILQGEVESIAQMKPKAEREGDDGILEYLEDIIGTSNYKTEIETSLTQLEELNDICVEKDNRLKIVEREMNSLEASKDSSIEYLKLEREYTVLKGNFYQHNKYLINDKLNIIEQKSLEFEQQLKNNKEEQKKLESLISDLKKTISKNTKTLQALENESKIVDENITSISNKKIGAEENKKNHEKTQQKNKTNFETAKKNFDIALKEIEESKNDIEIALSKITTLTEKINAEKETYETERAALQKKSVHLTQQISLLEQELEPSEQKIEQLKTDSTLKSQEIELLKKSSEKANETIKILEAKKNSAETILMENEKQISNLQTTTNTIDTKCKEKQAFLIETQKSFKLISESYAKEKHQLTEAKNSLSSNENNSKVIKALSKLQEQGRISGFHGKLGDLGVINAKYDVAISTAAPRLNDILVDTVECAQKCIEYLRTNRLGYARFILLDKLPNFNNAMNQTFKFLPNGVLRLFDLIQPAEKKFLPAFYSVVRDTLVSNNLSEANKVAYGGNKRFRVVTLDGKLIDISGTMSGGGRQKSKGLMKLSNNTKIDSGNTENLFVTSEQVKKMEKHFQETEAEYEKANVAISQTRDSIEKLVNELPDINVKISSLQFESKNLKSEIENCKQQLAQLESLESQNETLNSEKIKSLLTSISSIDTEINLIQDNIKPTTEKIDVLKKEISQLGGFEVEAKKNNIESLEKQLKKINNSIKKNKIFIKKKESEVERLQKSIDILGKDLESAINDLSKYDITISECIEKLSSLTANKNELTQNIESLKKENAKLSTEINEHDNDFSNYSKIKNEIELKLDEITKQKDKLSKTIVEEDKLLSNLKIRDVYESLKVLDCLPSVTEESFENDVVMESEDENNDIEKDSNDKMEIEEEENIKEEKDEDNMKVEEYNDEDIMEIPEKTDKPETTTSSSRPISHIDYLKLHLLTIEESNQINKDSLENEIALIKEKLDASSVNILTLEDYVIKFKSFKEKEKELSDAVQNRDTVKEKSEQLKKQRYDQFMEGFNIISQSLKEMYQMITMGGNAELELVDSIDPFSEGILFSVMPPKKSWRNISNLSGGEKTLSSLALVFALHNYKPTPIYIMDEIDAALDFKNVSIVANYIKDRTKDAQFIVISLRNNMFELSERLVGIYKNQNMTKSTTLENIDFIHS
ncbi:hypothetical protein ACO0SA_004132 [Hanseniaspora valbyensis]